jgi:phosphoglycerate dehydrogenase-like enzyme
MKLVCVGLVAVLLGLFTGLAAAETLSEQLGLRASSSPVRDDPRWAPQGPIVVRINSPASLARIQAMAGEVKLIGAGDAAQALAAVSEATAILGFCSAEILAAGPKLRWVQLYSAGAERCVSLPRVQSGEVLVTNMQRVSSPQIAEHVIGLLLALTRGLGPYLANQYQGVWDPLAVPASKRWEIAGRELLVVGLGGIGSEVARRAHALGMRVTAIRASGRPGPAFVSEVAKPDALLTLAARADAVVNSAPLTAETRGLFNAEFFAAMPAHGYFINVGRGASVVTDDLVAALSSGQIAGAGLDVTDPEPLPADHPLWRAPNVIITPHVAAGSDKLLIRLLAVAEENLRRYLAGEAMLSVVDPQRGY